MAVKNKYSIERNYINNQNARSRQKIDNIQFLVSHETANNTADADNHYSYFNNIDFSASAHTFIDDNKILEIIPLDEKAWHVNYGKKADNRIYGADANDAAIGTELCRTGVFEEAYDKYVWYHAYLCHKFGLNPQLDVVSHSRLDPERRSDPQSWLEPNGVSWDEFINDVQLYFNDWNGGAKPTSKPKESGSIVDYMNDKEMDSSYDNRAKLAKQYGIRGYGGTAKQNLELLEKLKEGKPKTNKGLPRGVLKKGDAGKKVRKVQEALSSVYFYPNKGAKNNGVDSLFGPNTANAVKRFQSINGLRQDGIYGPKTRKALRKAMR